MLQHRRESAPESPPERWFADATDAQKEAAVHVLLAVATSDGSLAPEEKRTIADACGKLGISSVDFARALADGMPEAVDAPASRAARTQLMLDAAAVMAADRKIDDRELAVLLAVGRSLGFRAEEVADFAGKVASALASRERRAATIDRLLNEMGHESGGPPGR
jgi:tellurite resistance protein